MKKALMVGINDYAFAPLTGCVHDATEVETMLSKNGDDSPNFSTRRMDSTLKKIDRALLKKEICHLFSNSVDIALFYFSGHGVITPFGGYLVTQDCVKYDEGISMHDLMEIANSSPAQNKIIILDCCYSGEIGSIKINNDVSASLIYPGVSILTACGPIESAVEINGQGVFTNLLLEALRGGCADLLGHITPGNIYAFVDRAMGPWGQRPLFKANISQFVSLRDVKPPINTDILRNLTKYFTTPVFEFKLDPSYEYTVQNCNPRSVEIMKNLQKMERVGLVVPVDEEHMYYAAMNSRSCKLTSMGVQYWKLVKEKQI